MLLGSRGSRIRCLVVWTAATAGLGATAVAAHASLAHISLTTTALRRTPLDVALTQVAALALLACALWLWAATTAVVVEVLRGGAGAGRDARGVPPGVRRMVLAACGVALVGGLAQPSYAHTAHGHRSPLVGLPLPDRAVAAPLRPTSLRAGAPERPIRVQPGDTLWSLAARDLPPGSPDASIARRWHAIYAANRSVIGPDPDVIDPGQRLRLPGKEPS